ncbi:MAG: signal peptide peptidase SppA [Desulfobacterales bacterium]|nr:signal peptide peptidase SppA [Desulfobacterales bacterium]
MFSRRHPFLFFLLSFSAIMMGGIIIISLLITIGSVDSKIGFKEKVGVIEISGIITDARNVIYSLKQFREDDSIKAIVLRIESPGGGVGPSQEIYREIRKTIKSKKVIASLGAVAASGGYYAAAGADGIVANPGTITGSIGVIMSYTNFREVLNKIGLVPVVIKSGEFKDIGSPVREMTDREQKLLKGFVDTVHGQFVSAIIEGRKIDRSKVEAIADGRIFSGEEAKTLGLVDRLGNMEDAVEWAGHLGGIKGKIITVYPKEEKVPFIKYLIDSYLGEFISDAVNPGLRGGYLYSPN